MRNVKVEKLFWLEPKEFMTMLLVSFLASTFCYLVQRTEMSFVLGFTFSLLTISIQIISTKFLARKLNLEIEYSLAMKTKESRYKKLAHKIPFATRLDMGKISLRSLYTLIIVSFSFWLLKHLEPTALEVAALASSFILFIDVFPIPGTDGFYLFGWDHERWFYVFIASIFIFFIAIFK